MSEELGNKELKEVAVGAVSLTFLLIKLAKDGVQVSDAVALAGAVQSDQKLKDALDGAGKALDEAKNLSVAEGLDLAVAVVTEVMAQLKA